MNADLSSGRVQTIAVESREADSSSVGEGDATARTYPTMQISVSSFHRMHAMRKRTSWEWPPRLADNLYRVIGDGVQVVEGSRNQVVRALQRSESLSA